MKNFETRSRPSNPTGLTVSERGASTPRPWQLIYRDIGGPFLESVADADGEKIRVVGMALSMNSRNADPEPEANAELIVRAVNAHDAMLAALKAAVELADRERPKFDYRTDECQEIYQQCKDAIAKAEGDRTAPAKTETVA